MGPLEEAMSPALLNWIDDIVVLFSPLYHDDLKDIEKHPITATVKCTEDDQNIKLLNVSDIIAKIATTKGSTQLSL